jgi:hypothetical protein
MPHLIIYRATRGTSLSHSTCVSKERDFFLLAELLRTETMEESSSLVSLFLLWEIYSCASVHYILKGINRFLAGYNTSRFPLCGSVRIVSTDQLLLESNLAPLPRSLSGILKMPPSVSPYHIGNLSPAKVPSPCILHASDSIPIND